MNGLRASYRAPPNGASFLLGFTAGIFATICALACLGIAGLL